MRGDGFPWKLFQRFVGGQVLLIAAALALAGLSARALFQDWFLTQADAQAQEMARSLKAELDRLDRDSSLSWCSGRIHGPMRFAILRPEGGAPLCDGTGLSAADLAGVLQRAGRDLVAARQEGGVPVLLSTVTLADGRLLRAAQRLPELRQAMSYLDRGLAMMLALWLVCFGVFSAWSARRVVQPLGRLISKARRLSEAGGPALSGGDDPDASDFDDAGEEWGDLESNLDRIRGDLRSKTEALAREREELATLMSAISDAILAVDRQGVPLFFNSRFALNFGSRDLVVDPKARLFELIRAPELLAAFKGVLEGGGARTVSVSLHVSGDSVPRYFSVSLAPLRREGEPAYGAVGIFHDVTELKRAEQIRIDFVANVSHEIRTPLTSIKGYADTLKLDVASKRYEDVGRYIDVISKNVERLMALINDLLDISSLEGGAEVMQGTIDVAELTSRVLHQVESLRASKNHQIEVAYQASTVQGDARRVEQVLVNLLENAIKYVPAGGRIKVSWAPSAKGVLLKIADNGPGIPPEHQPRLFERFYRVDKARSRELGGTGLGLAIVKHIMQVHGGSVYVMSEPGKGAEFVCQFPNSV